MLGELGAEVIKIEDRVHGDLVRWFKSVNGVSMEIGNGRNLFFEFANRNKKSITLDLKKPEAREVVYDLVKESDVFLQCFRSGTAESLGLGYEVLRQYNPKLIYASASGYGPLGPDAARPVLDNAAAARSGFMELMNPLGDPYYHPAGLLDQMGGVIIAYAVLAAIVARERLGVGQKIDSSLLSSVTWLMSVPVHTYLMGGREFPRTINRVGGVNPMNNSFQCADGKWFVILLNQTERFWPSFCEALGIEALAKDARFDTAEKRASKCAELTSMFDKIFATKTLAEWFEIFKGYPDFVYEAIKSIRELATDPQMLENNYIVDVPDRDLGTLKMLNIPFTLSETPGSIRSVAPELGQHTEEVLQEVCGYSWEKIAELREKEVI
jgi:formyl-CoA transferase